MNRRTCPVSLPACLVLLLLLAAAGCGQKGDLYLPDRGQADAASSRPVTDLPRHG